VVILQIFWVEKHYQISCSYRLTVANETPLKSSCTRLHGTPLTYYLS